MVEFKGNHKSSPCQYSRPIGITFLMPCSQAHQVLEALPSLKPQPFERHDARWATGPSQLRNLQGFRRGEQELPITGVFFNFGQVVNL